MTNAGLLHHHSDGTSHNECHICSVISVAIAIVLTFFIIFFRAKLIFKIIPLQNFLTTPNHLNLNCPDRAPPNQNT